MLPRPTLKELTGFDVTKFSSLIAYGAGKLIVAWIASPAETVIGFVGDNWVPYAKFGLVEDTELINGESSENVWFGDVIVHSLNIYK